MQFPAPSRPPATVHSIDYGYPDEVLFPVDMEVAPGLKTGAPAVLSAKVDWLVCEGKLHPRQGHPHDCSVKTGATPSAAAGPAGADPDHGTTACRSHFRLVMRELFGSADASGIRLSVRTAQPATDAAFFPFDQARH